MLQISVIALAYVLNSGALMLIYNCRQSSKWTCSRSSVDVLL